MRLFTGISIPPNISDALERTVLELRATADLNWSPRENWHITTKFIGEWPEERVAELQRSLREAAKRADFDVTVARFGFFPNPHHPQAFFAGIHAGPELNQLSGNLDVLLAKFGREPEKREYSPHLTLAKIKNQDIREMREFIARHGAPEFGTFQATNFHLYSSETSKIRSVYSIVETYPFAGQEAHAG